MDIKTRFGHEDTKFVMCQDRAPDRKKSIDPNYKAGRKSNLEPHVVEDLNQQIRKTMEIIDLMPVYRAYKQGEECDDILYTLSRSNDGSTLIVTNDHDINQCLKDNVHILSIKDDEIITAEKFEKKMGVTPQQFGVVQSLSGDPTDNVPGIKGIGEKTAIKTVQMYPDIEQDILDRKVCLDKLPPRAQKPFNKDLYDTYIKTRDLVMLGSVPFVTMKKPNYDVQKLEDELNMMECHSLIKEMRNDPWLGGTAHASNMDSAS
jgi:5'-3' exonuclease